MWNYLLAGAVTAPPAHAQCTLDTFTGTWVFSMEGFAVPRIQVLAAAGRIVATISPSGSGVLAITSTSGVNGTTTRLEKDAGRFQVNSDCSGGTLTFNLSSRPAQFDFFFVHFGKIVFVGTNNGDVLLGKAERTGTPGPGPI